MVTFSHAAALAPPECELDYVRTYHRIDPRARHLMDRPTGDWLNCWELLDDSFVAADPFYQEFLIPYGGRYVSGTKLLQDGPINVFWGIHRGRDDAPLDRSEIEVCKRLSGHLTQALKLSQAHLRLRRVGWLGAELLANVRAPLALLDGNRRLIHANESARQLLHRSKAILDHEGHLCCRRTIDDKAFLGALQQLLPDAGVEQAGPPIERVFCRANAPGSAECLGLYLQVLHAPATLRAFGDRSLVLVLIQEFGRRVELDPFVLATGFDLTPGEARVAVSVANGNSLQDIAEAHSVSINTVRSQLQSIFGKTGVSRQSELVSLLAASPMAAAGLPVF